MSERGRFKVGDQVVEVIGVGENAVTEGPRAQRTIDTIADVEGDCCQTATSAHWYDRLTGKSTTRAKVYRAIHSPGCLS